MIVVFCCCCCCFGVICFALMYVMLLSKLEAGQNQKRGGAQEVEQLPVKIKGGSYVCNS